MLDRLRGYDCVNTKRAGQESKLIPGRPAADPVARRGAQASSSAPRPPGRRLRLRVHIPGRLEDAVESTERRR